MWNPRLTSSWPLLVRFAFTICRFCFEKKTRSVSSNQIASFAGIVIQQRLPVFDGHISVVLELNTGTSKILNYLIKNGSSWYILLSFTMFCTKPQVPSIFQGDHCRLVQSSRLATPRLKENPRPIRGGHPPDSLHPQLWRCQVPKPYSSSTIWNQRLVAVPWYHQVKLTTDCGFLGSVWDPRFSWASRSCKWGIWDIIQHVQHVSSEFYEQRRTIKYRKSKNNDTF